MNEVKYIGEHLWVGEVGHFFIITSFVTALLSGVAYYFATTTKNEHKPGSWARIGRYSFYIHGFTLFGLIAILFYAMYNHMYEYDYVFNHVSEELPLKYILSAFWEGQEGSFMLWMFWHAVLGFVLIRTAGKFEAPVMFTIAIAEAILMTMLLGLHFPFGEEVIRIGSNPTNLLRHMTEAPIFNNANYLSLIKGRGMNPLLQNYWMTIHPPTLFLGFASTIVPFAFAFAGLWLNDHSEWLKKSLKWSLFSAGILGTGILMGSLWAYVALSFGGYWAWDPVENASLVPWITMVAGIHVHLVSKNTGYAIRSVYFYYLISFILILYSTFLTRSGVLGDTSAHAFTEMGLEWQLVFIVGYFMLTGFALYFLRYSKIDNHEKEEALPSREFWMFIGSLVLMFSAVLIITSTSLPVFNKLMTWYNPAYEGKVIKNAIEHYNKYQLWIAVFVSILSSASLFLRYRAVNWQSQRKKWIIRMLSISLISAILTWILSLWLHYYSWQYVILAFTGLFSIISNADYLIFVIKGNIKLAYAAFAHFGFGLMIIGMLASGLNQQFISSNPFVFKGMFTDEDLQKYVQLIKGKPLFSQGYFITYESDTLIGRERKYNINFKKLNDSLETIEEITLHPNAMYSNDFSKIAAFNPDTRHYLHKDIFTCVVGVPPALQSVEEARKIEDSLKFTTYTVPLGDSLTIQSYTVKAQSITFEPQNKEYKGNKHETGLGLNISVYDAKNDTTLFSEAAVGLQGAIMYNYPAAFEQAGLRIKLDESVIEQLFTLEDKLVYQEYTITKNGVIDLGDYKISLTGFDKDPQHENYIKEDLDIAIGAQMNISGKGVSEDAAPIYIIRKNQPMSIKHYSGQTGLHIRFSNIDPEKESFSFKIARDLRKNNPLKIGIATDVPRTDYLILQATIFPGINLFWTGSIMMMLGLFMAAWSRYKNKT